MVQYLIPSSKRLQDGTLCTISNIWPLMVKWIWVHSGRAYTMLHLCFKSWNMLFSLSHTHTHTHTSHIHAHTLRMYIYSHNTPIHILTHSLLRALTHVHCTSTHAHTYTHCVQAHIQLFLQHTSNSAIYSFSAAFVLQE